MSSIKAHSTAEESRKLALLTPETPPSNSHTGEPATPAKKMAGIHLTQQ